MDMSATFRRALQDLDVSLIRKVWRVIAPHLPQPKTDEDALMALHVARTGADSMDLGQRAYSHAWLLERGLPSQLPDHLKPSAQRMYPVTVSSVGISVTSKHEFVKDSVQGVMRLAVLDCYGNGDEDPKIVKPRMMDAKDKELKALFGLKRR